MVRLALFTLLVSTSVLLAASPDNFCFGQKPPGERPVNWESSIAPDGKRMFFASNRPPSSGMDIWMVERTSDTSWSDPVRLPEPVNSAAEDGSPCVTKNGTLYFKSLRTGGIGGS